MQAFFLFGMSTIQGTLGLPNVVELVATLVFCSQTASISETVDEFHFFHRSFLNNGKSMV